jgi:hypothetical protein
MNTKEPGWTSVTTECSAHSSAVPVPPVVTTSTVWPAPPQVVYRAGELVHGAMAALPALVGVADVLEVTPIALDAQDAERAECPQSRRERRCVAGIDAAAVLSDVDVDKCVHPAAAGPPQRIVNRTCGVGIVDDYGEALAGVVA